MRYEVDEAQALFEGIAEEDRAHARQRAVKFCVADDGAVKFCVADDEESYLAGHEFDTREEAAAFGFAEFDYADTIFTARVGDPIRPVISVGDVESWIEQVCHDLPDGEDDEWMGDKDTGSLAQALTKALHAWLDAHDAWPQSYPLLDEQKHERPKEEIAARLAQQGQEIAAELAAQEAAR